MDYLAGFVADSEHFAANDRQNDGWFSEDWYPVSYYAAR
jgi:hypothetical protein